MTKLKYGKVYIDEGSIRSALGLTGDTHIELIGVNSFDGTIEFNIVANSENANEWLSDKTDNGIANLRRVRVPFEIKEEGLPTIEEMRYAKEFSDALNAITGKFGMGIDEAIGFVKEIAKTRK